MYLKRTLLLLLLALNLTSCLQYGVINFKGKKSNLSAADNIKSFMAENKNPSILLRIPTHVQKTTEGKHHNYLYSAIENELAIAGFAVRDRGLFNEVLQFEKVAFRIDERNIKSRKAVENIGGVLEGVLRKNTLMLDGFRRSTCCYGILKDEWATIKSTVFKAYI